MTCLRRHRPLLPATAVLGVALLSLGLAEWHTPYLLLLALLAAVCLLCGAINGLLVLAAGLPPLLATLSTSVAFTGLTDLLTGQRRIAVSDPLMVAFRDNSVLGLPWPLVYLLGVFILFPVPAPPLPLRPACAGGGRQSAIWRR
ncbi:transmembrane sugar transport protein [Klebsiella pneumoniae]|uniref:Transmembrane sugar transport protein n=1 Tax=Klebsiella pneumoniae TaxID=573 RepID=A0A378F8D0_KLEPN|nr:transmembrane sugar transport protein [Klebsiella pneumoniae]